MAHGPLSDIALNYAHTRTDFARWVAIGDVQRIGARDVDCLCKCNVKDDKLVVEISHLQHAATDTVMRLSTLADSYAKLHRLSAYELIVHTRHCALPNIELQNMLARRNFAPADRSSIGKVYTRTVPMIT